MVIAAASGNYEYFLKKMKEDVIVFGHTHEHKNQKSTERSNEFHYANSGSWTDTADCVSRMHSMFLYAFYSMWFQAPGKC